jgi:hypothetical protein
VAQELPLDSLLAAHAFEVNLRGGELDGPGLRLIQEAAKEAQFVLIAEEHNVRELNEFSEALFMDLNREHGFDYLALEQGSIFSSWLGSGGRRGNLAEIIEVAGRYPHAATFATDEEFRLIKTVGEVSSARSSPIWGVDQEFGALHILDSLRTFAPNDQALEQVEKIAASARSYESDRSGEVHYLSQVAEPGDFQALSDLFSGAESPEAIRFVEALQRTVRIYHFLSLAQQGFPTGFENGREREENMRRRFLEWYRGADSDGDSLPRVMAKLGHWHVLRGFFRANVPTFGNFLSEFAISNGMTSFVLSVYVVDGPENWRNTGGPLAAAAGPSQFTLVDFRPLRALAHQNSIAGLGDGLKDIIFRADAALLIRGGRTGSYGYVSGSPGL